MADKTMPPLPQGSVDLDVLHKADADGKNLEEAIAKATVKPKPRPVSEKRQKRLAEKEKATVNDGLKNPAPKAKSESKPD